MEHPSFLIRVAKIGFFSPSLSALLEFLIMVQIYLNTVSKRLRASPSCLATLIVVVAAI